MVVVCFFCGLNVYIQSENGLLQYAYGCRYFYCIYCIICMNESGIDIKCFSIEFFACAKELFNRVLPPEAASGLDPWIAKTSGKWF